MQTINLGQTVYGGTLNVGTGLLTVTHEMVDLGDFTYIYNSTNDYFYTSSPNDSVGNITGGNEGICSCYKLFQGNVTGFKATDMTFTYNNSSFGGSKVLFIRDTTTTDPTTLKTNVTGQKLVYELATPQTYQLTPAQIEQLLGQNNVFCSSGDVAVKYWKID